MNKKDQKQVKVVGLQRSGTNYLTELLKANFEDRIYDDPMHPFFKHSLPTEDTVVLNSGIIVKQIPPVNYDWVYLVFVYKKFSHWLESIKRNPADLKLKRPEIFNEDGSISEVKARKLHSSFFDAWTEVCDIAVPYECLVKDFKFVLEDLEKSMLLHPKGETYVDVETVPQSPNFKPEDKQKYLS